MSHFPIATKRLPFFKNVNAQLYIILYFFQNKWCIMKLHFCCSHNNDSQSKVSSITLLFVVISFFDFCICTYVSAIEPYCTFNRTIYSSGAIQRCPTQLGLNVTPYLKAFYGLIAVVLLLNLLIAMYR